MTTTSDETAAPASLAGARRREQTRARYPDLTGYVERDGVRVFYEVYGVGRADRLPAADLVDRPLAVLEGADPVPGPPLPGRDVRRPRQRPLGPPGRPSRVHPGRVRRRRARGHGRDRHRAGGAGGALVRRAVGARSSPPTTRSASSGIVYIAPAVGARARPPRARGASVRRGARRPTRAGPSTTATTGSGTTWGSSSSSSPSASPSRTRPSRSRTASAGRSRPIPRRSPTPPAGSGWPAGPRASGRPARACAARRS